MLRLGNIEVYLFSYIVYGLVGFWFVLLIYFLAQVELKYPDSIWTRRFGWVTWTGIQLLGGICLIPFLYLLSEIFIYVRAADSDFDCEVDFKTVSWSETATRIAGQESTSLSS